MEEIIGTLMIIVLVVFIAAAILYYLYLALPILLIVAAGVYLLRRIVKYEKGRVTVPSGYIHILNNGELKTPGEEWNQTHRLLTATVNIAEMHDDRFNLRLSYGIRAAFSVKWYPDPANINAYFKRSGYMTRDEDGFPIHDELQAHMNSFVESCRAKRYPWESAANFLRFGKAEEFYRPFIDSLRLRLSIIGVRLESLDLIETRGEYASITTPVGDTVDEKGEPDEEFAIPDEVRPNAVYIIGLSGSGKSTLLVNMALRDIAAGKGVCFLDPHPDKKGDMNAVRNILHRIPKHRVKDVIWYDATDLAHPIPINILSTNSPLEIPGASARAIGILKGLDPGWGPRMGSILRKIVDSLLIAGECSFMDIHDVIVSPGKAIQIAKRLADKNRPDLQYFWEKEWPDYFTKGGAAKDALDPIYNRMTDFACSPVLRPILGVPYNRLDFLKIINDRKILLVNLGFEEKLEFEKRFIGSTIIGMFQRAAVKSKRPFYLYADEFYYFKTAAYDEIIDEMRGYQFCLTVAHQRLQQLDEDTKKAVKAAGTRLFMRISPDDVSEFTTDLGLELARSLKELPKFQAWAKGPFGEIPFSTRPLASKSESYADVIIAQTRRQFGARATHATASASDIPANPEKPGNPDDWE
ncbi:MAG TPA: hypothetical protein VKU01_20685 [Bryobacteraceae bacterium]|nr:hypothetical protein [Bryobacteraceae bacterium]